jgi:hypothetical protein
MNLSLFMYCILNLFSELVMLTRLQNTLKLDERRFVVSEYKLGSEEF